LLFVNVFILSAAPAKRRGFLSDIGFDVVLRSDLGVTQLGVLHTVYKLCYEVMTICLMNFTVFQRKNAAVFRKNEAGDYAVFP